MQTFLFIFLFICLASYLPLFFMMFRNNWVHKKRCLYIDMFYKYDMHMITSTMQPFNGEVSDQLWSYEKMYHHFWIWNLDKMVHR